MIDGKKYQIFVSSTYIDFKKTREKVIKTILELNHIPIGMEMFSAEDEEQWEIIKRTIDESDYYVLILGLRYGNPTKDGISFTEKEYDYALSKGIPILSFLKDEDASYTNKERDDDLTKIRKFREKVLNNNKMAKPIWNTPDDLATQISISLTKQFNLKHRIGWIRADKATLSPEITQKLARLSKENSFLREENQKLKELYSNDKVDLEVLINNSSKLKLTFYKDLIFHKKLISKLKKDRSSLIRFHRLMENPKKITIDDIKEDLKSFINKDDIEKYNRELPTKEEIDKINIELDYYNRKYNGEKLSILIKNRGKIKANSLKVEIEFPQKVVLLSSEEEREKSDKDLKNIKIPKYPKDLNEIAEERKEKLQNSNFMSHNYIAGGDITYRYNLEESSLLKEIKKLQIIKNDIYLQNNKITIKIPYLLHTDNKIFQDFYISPMKLGEYEIKVTFICEEMKEAKSFNIPLIIEEKNQC